MQLLGEEAEHWVRRAGAKGLAQVLLDVDDTSVHVLGC
jgi:hypothetical protein